MDKKEEIIINYLLGKSTYRQLEKKYEVPRSIIHQWVQKFQGIIPDKRIAKNDLILPAMIQGEKEELPKEIIELREQLANEKLRNKLLTAIIEIAETEFNIPIRKKYGTKPLKK